MRTETKPVYHCSYCSEYYIHKHHAEKHEKYCKNNPANKHKCFEGCVHLERMDINAYEMNSYRGCKTFKCAANDRFLYSYKAESRRNFVAALNAFEPHERMPLECPHYTDDDMRANKDFKF